MSLMGHERRIRANAPAAGRPQAADPAGGQGGFRLGPAGDILDRIVGTGKRTRNHAGDKANAEAVAMLGRPAEPAATGAEFKT